VTESDFQIFEVIGALVVVLDVDGRIVHWNSSCSDLTGYSLEEVRGRRISEFLLIPEEVEVVGAAFATLQATAPPRAFANHWVTKTGERRWIAWSHTFITHPDGQLKYIIKTGIDRTLRDVPEQERLKKERELLAELGEVLATTLDYDETLTHIARLMVKDLADFCVLDLLDRGGTLRRMKVLHRDPGKTSVSEMWQRLPVDRQHARVVLSVVESKQPRLMSEVPPEYLESTAQTDEHLRAMRELDPRSLITVPLMARGDLIGALVLVSSHPSRRYGRDDLRLAEEVARRAALAIDNAKLYENARRLTHDLREANEHMVSATIQAQELTEAVEGALARSEKGERELRAVAEFREMFIGIVGHDLRNPLGSIRLAVETQLQRGHLDDHDRMAAKLVVKSIERMTRMIHQLLDLTRARLGGGFPIEPRPTTLRDVCQNVVEEFGAAIRLEIEGDVRGTWDPDRLTEALSNIAGNAVEHARPGTEVVVRAHSEGAEVVVEIINQGDPIPAEVLPFIFEPFRRGRHEKAATGNLGLGLYIAKQIVLASGGTLDARSVDGTTTFVMRLPRDAPSANPSLSQAEARA